MSDHLKLVTAFRLQDYKHILTVTFEFDPEHNHIDHLYENNLDYQEFRQRDFPLIKEQTVRAYLNNGGISDYHMFLERGELKLYLKTDEDMMVAMAALMPEKTYAADFLECSQYCSARKIKKRAKQLQQLFDQTKLQGYVTFTADNERKTVRATAQGQHFIRLFGIAKEIEQAIGMSLS